MPLKHGKSQKDFESNVKTEMATGKPKDQSLAIAYSVKRKKPKKMASGGAVNESAKTEHRPMPEERDKAALMISQNSGNKPPHNDSWTDRSTVAQAQRPSKTPLRHPKMVPQSLYSVRLRDEEDHLQESAGTNEGPQQQPPSRLDEEGANRQGPTVPALKMKRMADGGSVMHLKPSMDEGDQYAIDHEEMGQNRQGPGIMDNEEEHSLDTLQFHDSKANEDHTMELNPAHDKHSPDDSQRQPEEEADMEHEDSIAAAIMAKRERMASGGMAGAQQSIIDRDLGSGEARQDRKDLEDSDQGKNGFTKNPKAKVSDKPKRMMAEGGEIHSHPSIYSDDSDQADLSRNADEDANEEDQLSFNALRKENYSETPGLRQLDSPMDSAQTSDDEEMDSHDKHDRVSRIMSKMNARRQFKQR